MAERSHRSIGEVLSLLRDEFPDVTISKIRFLESQGLVDPERTPSGYRKFYEEDVERLRWILRQQKEHFLPLKVIRGRLTEQEENLQPGETGETPFDGPESSDGDDDDGARPPVDGAGRTARHEMHTGESETFTLTELAHATGLTTEEVVQLEQFGLLSAKSSMGGSSYFDADALQMARVAANFARHGVEARHLRGWKTSADREASVFEQVVVPLLRQRNPQSRREAYATLEEMTALGSELRELLVRQAVRAIH